MQTRRTVTALCLAALLYSACFYSTHCWGQAPSAVPPTALSQGPAIDLSQGSRTDPAPRPAPTTDEQERKKQELALVGILSRFDAAAALMNQGRTKEAIVAYLPLLQNEPNFGDLNSQVADLKVHTEALQEQIFQVQRQDPSLSTPIADDLATQKIALEGQRQAIQKVLQLQPPFAEAHANLAHLLMESGAAASSLRQYEAAIRLRPALAASLRPAILHAHLVEADRLAKLGRPEAASEYHAAIKLDPNNASAHYGLGSLLLALNNAKDAVPELQSAARLDPSLSDAALTLGLALYRSGHGEEARQDWRRLAESPDPRVSEEAHGLLDRYLLTLLPGNKSAPRPLLNVSELEVQRCREQVRNYPHESFAHNNLALALFHAKQKEEALQEVQTALKLDPDSIEAHTNLGMLLCDKDQGDAAADEYKRALALDSDNGAVHNNLGVVYFNRQQWKLAEYEFHKALEGNRSDPYAHHNLADTMLQEGRLAESIKECGKTLEYDSHFFAAYATRGLVEDKMGRTAQGLTDIKLTVQAADDPAQSLLDLADPLRQFAGPRVAASQFREILRLYPQTAAGEETLGRLLLAAGLDRDAAGEFQAAVHLDPARTTGHFLLARALLRLDRQEAAAAEAREALKLDPNSAEARNTLGMALYQEGQTQAGRSEWQAVLALDNKDAARNAAGLLQEFP